MLRPILLVENPEESHPDLKEMLGTVADLRVIDMSQPLPNVLRTIQAGVEEEYIRKALEQAQGNVSRCARICGISRRSLWSKLGAYQINKSVFKPRPVAHAPA